MGATVFAELREGGSFSVAPRQKDVTTVACSLFRIFIEEPPFWPSPRFWSLLISIRYCMFSSRSRQSGCALALGGLFSTYCIALFHQGAASLAEHSLLDFGVQHVSSRSRCSGRALALGVQFSTWCIARFHRVAAVLAAPLLLEFSFHCEEPPVWPSPRVRSLLIKILH